MIERTKNQVVDHLSRWEEEGVIKISYWIEINDAFPDEQVLGSFYDHIPLLAHFPNYVASHLVLSALLIQQRKLFMFDVNKLY